MKEPFLTLYFPMLQVLAVIERMDDRNRQRDDKVVPFPSPPLLTLTEPPCSSARLLTIESPSPSPL